MHLRKEPVRKTFSNCDWKLHESKCVGATSVIKQTFDFMGPATWKPETCFCDMSLLLPFWTSPAARKPAEVGAGSAITQFLQSLQWEPGAAGHSSSVRCGARRVTWTIPLPDRQGAEDWSQAEPQSCRCWGLAELRKSENYWGWLLGKALSCYIFSNNLYSKKRV